MATVKSMRVMATGLGEDGEPAVSTIVREDHDKLEFIRRTVLADKTYDHMFDMWGAFDLMDSDELLRSIHWAINLLEERAELRVRKEERERYDELLTDKLAEFQDEYAERVAKLEKELADLRGSFNDAEKALDEAWDAQQPD